MPPSHFLMETAAAPRGARQHYTPGSILERSMSMEYPQQFIPPSAVPDARIPLLAHLVETYASETSKTAGVWSELADAQLEFQPHARSSTVRQILVHQLLSERRFFAEFIGLNEPAVDAVLPAGETPGVAAYTERLVSLARQRLLPLAAGDENFWLTSVPFFDVRRERIWVFWRRVLHTAHHRAQVGLCLRLLEARVPPTYGPTADVTWTGADPTTTLDAARRRGA
ncbi:MAG TPA: DinB family protein [Gemmatimonadales bacterium]|nr:DinB family protein [Gemmatimonadales bacterium]